MVRFRAELRFCFTELVISLTSPWQSLHTVTCSPRRFSFCSCVWARWLPEENRLNPLEKRDLRINYG